MAEQIDPKPIIVHLQGSVDVPHLTPQHSSDERIDLAFQPVGTRPRLSGRQTCR